MTYNGDECLWSWQRLLDKTYLTAWQTEYDPCQYYYESTERSMTRRGSVIFSGWVSTDEPVFYLN